MWNSVYLAETGKSCVTHSVRIVHTCTGSYFVSHDIKFLLFLLSSVRFHLGHLFEMQNKCDLAQEMYETIIETPNAPNTVRANAYKQLGKYITC